MEAIAEQPGNPDKILIGYNRGLMVLWDRKTPGAQQVLWCMVILFSRNIQYDFLAKVILFYMKGLYPVNIPEYLLIQTNVAFILLII